MTIIGIDPGVKTGVASLTDGKITSVSTIPPHKIAVLLGLMQPDLVVYEDSRLISHSFTTATNRAAALKIARNVGEIDAWCKLIEFACKELRIVARGISPKNKGAKLNSDHFKRLTGFTGLTNQHERDAAMCAWPYRLSGHPFLICWN